MEYKYFKKFEKAFLIVKYPRASIFFFDSHCNGIENTDYKKRVFTPKIIKGRISKESKRRFENPDTLLPL